MDRLQRAAGEVIADLELRGTLPPPSRELWDERVAKQREQWLSEASIQRWLEHVGVGVRLRELAIDEAMLPARSADWARDWKRGAMMLLCGPPGAGKTATAVHCLREAFRQGEVNDFENLVWRWGTPTVCYAKARDLYAAVFARNEALLAAARSRNILVVDEWGGAYEHAWPLAEMDGIIDHRWERRWPTIITTNLTPEQFSQAAPRSFDRIGDEPGPGVVVLNRESMRGVS